MFSRRISEFTKSTRRLALFGLCFCTSQAIATDALPSIGTNSPPVAGPDLVIRTQALQIQSLPPVNSQAVESVTPQVIPPSQLPPKPLEKRAIESAH